MAVPQTSAFYGCASNLRILWLYPHRNAWASLHLLGQPNTFLAISYALTVTDLNPYGWRKGSNSHGRWGHYAPITAMTVYISEHVPMEEGT